MKRWVALAAAAGACAAAAELRPETAAAFDRYVRQVETRFQALVTQGDGFLFAATPERRAWLRTGAVLTESPVPQGELRAPFGLIHDWVGAVYVSGARVANVIEVLEAYDRHQEYFRPEVVDSRLLWRSGPDFRVALRLLKKKVITVVLDTEHAIHYEQRDATRWWSLSRSTRIAEVRDPSQPQEKLLPPGTGRGLLWRLNSYWTFQELDGGTYVECRAVTLTRNVPRGLAWLLEPILRGLPRESLANTLRSTRAAAQRPALP